MSLLPPNATRFERALEAATARISDVPVPLRTLWNPDTCPVQLLPYLAWALSIDVWSTDWPEWVKRERIRRAIAIQRRKGTAGSVADVVAAYGAHVVVREWWQAEPRMAPHTFALVLSLNGEGGEPATAAYVDQVISDIRRTKPLRSHFTFTQALAATAKVGVIGAARALTFARVQLAAPAAA
ncbi:phage tail protein I [Sphingomonas jatrophae]|uniref:Phage tail protein, P2 protein I family n=1 Tax=Sphingomonas jatrophae TaxID=1166337 RepID=A0A1I6JLC9_9SPHN|nr:phage tail protein I [Sphingomonas jatrophae]SFR79785.1 phage tail protein, P2 protein I family [Sphingomonas jatrophae]